MSFTQLGQASGAVTITQSVVYPTQYVVAISLAILLYDYCITFSDEVNWMWRGSRKLSLITILFFVQRYLSIFLVPVIGIQYFWDSADPGRFRTCKVLTSFHHAMIFVCQTVVGVILVVRTYALYNKNRWVLALLCPIIAASSASAIWAITVTPSGIVLHQNPLPPRGCILPISFQSIKSFMPSIVMGMSTEMLVFCLTLHKSIQIIRTENSTVLRILLRDGGLYFGVVSLAYVSLLVSYYVFDDYSRGNVATLAISIASTLVSRLILNLRDPSLSSDSRFETAYGAGPQAYSSDIISSIVDTSTSYEEANESVEFYAMKRYPSSSEV